MFVIEVVLKPVIGAERRFALEVVFEAGFVGSQAVVSLRESEPAVAVILSNYDNWSESPYRTAGRALQAMATILRRRFGDTKVEHVSIDINFVPDVSRGRKPVGSRLSCLHRIPEGTLEVSGVDDGLRTLTDAPDDGLSLAIFLCVSAELLNPWTGSSCDDVAVKTGVGMQPFVLVNDVPGCVVPWFAKYLKENFPDEVSEDFVAVAEPRWAEFIDHSIVVEFNESS